MIILKYLKENPDAASGYKYIPEGYLTKAEKCGWRSKHKGIYNRPRSWVSFQTKNVKGYDPFSEVCDSISISSGTDGDIRSIKLAIKEWLIGENYLAKDGANGRGFLETTILSPEAGIIEREKISQLA